MVDWHRFHRAVVCKKNEMLIYIAIQLANHLVITGSEHPHPNPLPEGDGDRTPNEVLNFLALPLSLRETTAWMQEVEQCRSNCRGRGEGVSEIAQKRKSCAGWAKSAQPNWFDI